ncbi:MAG: GNAT family N-acetyltransferase [Pseudomonadota bacterium]|mgnify:CR=1 FL=1
MTVSTRIADPADAEPLLRAYWAYIAELYPPDICYNYDLDELRGEGVAFFVAEQDGEPLGCVAFVDKGNGEGELKSMYVAESARGLGVADALVAAVEAEAEQRGCALILLETGDVLTAAQRLYARHGFSRRGPFGCYPDNARLVFMEKRLARAAG